MSKILSLVFYLHGVLSHDFHFLHGGFIVRHRGIQMKDTFQDEYNQSNHSLTSTGSYTCLDGGRKKNNKAAIRSGHLAGVANHTSLISTATHWRTEHWEYSQEFHLHPRYKVCLEAKSQVLVTTVRQWREVTVVPVKHSTTEESFYYRVSYTDFLSSLCLLCTKKKKEKESCSSG